MRGHGDNCISRRKAFLSAENVFTFQSGSHICFLGIFASSVLRKRGCLRVHPKVIASRSNIPRVEAGGVQGSFSARQLRLRFKVAPFILFYFLFFDTRMWSRPNENDLQCVFRLKTEGLMSEAPSTL